MQQKPSENMIMQALDWAYDKAVNGGLGLDSAEEMAKDYLKGSGTLADQVNALIRWQTAKAGTSGFVNNLGGVLLIPVTLPANITSVMFIQVRMVAAIAYMGGHDIRDGRVKTLAYVCLCGNAAKDLAKDIGIKVGIKFSDQAIRNLSYQTILKINRAVGFRLITKFGETGAVNLGKLLPFVGGVIGATIDSAATNTIGNVARSSFI